MAGADCMLFLFLISLSSTAGERNKDTNDSSVYEELFLKQLDKAASSVGESTYHWCRNGGWLSSNEQDSNKIYVSCHSVYELTGRAMMSMSPSFNLSLSLSLHDDDNDDCNGTEKLTAAEAYGYGSVMIFFISSLSLLGLILVPCLNQRHRLGRFISRYVLTMLTAMGVSALLCDVMFELIPTILHVSHGHDEDDHDDDVDISHNELIWKATGIVAGVFIFYLLELVLHMLMDTARKKKANLAIIRSSKVGDKRPLISTCVGGKDAVYQTDRCVRTPPSVSKKTFCQKVRSLKHVRPLAWIIIIGDLMHNAADGITLGVAISQSLALGLSTGFAICLHEVPHEMADFGILVKSGMHWLTALIFNFLSSLTAIVGFFIGVSIGTNSTAAKEWLLAIAAGSFLYIALADLLPELRLDSSFHSHDHDSSNHHSHQHKDEVQYTCCQKTAHGSLICVGFFFAFTILLVVSLNERNLNKLFC